MTGASAGRQRGFSLVELMVAMTVALILMAGILQILLSNRQSFEAQKTSEQLQNDARLASFVLENTVAQAGYRSNLAASDGFLFKARGDGQDNERGLEMARGAFIAGHAGGDKGDALRVRAQSASGIPDGIHDCLGGDNNDFAFVLTGDQDTLSCLTYNSDGSANTPAQPVVEHVERFKVRYGLDTDNDGTVETYTSPADGASLSDTQARQVRSVRLQLLLQSEANIAPDDQTRSYTFADGSTFTPDADRHAYRLVDKTIALRNALP